MKTALVLGISGGFGGHVATALLAHGWRVKAVLRDPARLPRQLRGVEVLRGDAGDTSVLEHAARDVQVLIYGLNLPYQHWRRHALQLLEPSVACAERNGLTVVFPGNVYGHDPADGPEFDETAAMHPPTAKGEVRQQMEHRLYQASRNGARLVVVRAGDFIGSHGRSTWMKLLSKPTARGYRLLMPGPVELEHTWAYLPDLANSVVRILDHRERLSPWEVFNFRGYRLSLEQLKITMEAATGRPVRATPFPWWVARLLAPLVPFVRELVEMRYLWQYPVHLNDDKLHSFLGGRVPHTPLAQALVEAGVVQRSAARQGVDTITDVGATTRR